MPHIRLDVSGRIRAWSRRWGPLLPVLGAELIIMIGFGALLPVLPLFVQEQGIDAAQLGLIVAAWPIAKLISEPFFGWWADRHSRKPQMLVGLVIFAVVSLLPIFFTTFAAQFVLRFLAGAAIGMYDPAARGMIVDATEPDERGEAFGYYGAFQVGGFVFGPAIGALGAAIFGGYAFPFVFTSVLAIVAMVVLVITLPAHPHVVEAPEFAHHPDARPTPTGMPYAGAETTAIPTDTPDSTGSTAQAPISALFNRPVVATLVLSFGLHLSFGVYEVIWSLYLVALGATVAWVGLSFVVFGIPEMIAAPVAGRWIDRKGPDPLRHRLRRGHHAGGDGLRPGQRPVLGHPHRAVRGHRHGGHGPGALHDAGARDATGPGLDGAGSLRCRFHAGHHRGLDRRRSPVRAEHGPALLVLRDRCRCLPGGGPAHLPQRAHARARGRTGGTAAP